MTEKTPNILVIGNEAPNCELLQETLKSKNMACDAVSSAQAALELLDHRVYDLALIDIRLPDIDGLQLLKQIRTLYPAVSTIILTAVSDLVTAVECMKAGARDYITKPVEMERLFGAIRDVLDKKSSEETLEYPDSTINDIQAIALGVEARQDILDVHSEKVIQQTVIVARQMGFNEDKIQQWAAVKSEEKAKKIKQVTASLFKMS